MKPYKLSVCSLCIIKFGMVFRVCTNLKRIHCFANALSALGILITARTSVEHGFFGYLSRRPMSFYRNNKVVVRVVIYSRLLITEVCRYY